MDSYVIVGAGVFGTSTALHLIRKYPHATITLVDRNAFDAPTRVAASWDWNKVVRADYNDIVYTSMALEARQVWSTDPLWSPFYHESGIYWISASGFAQKVLDNFKKLGVNADLDSLSVDEEEVVNVEFDADGNAAGVKTSTGEILRASKIILSTGAYTPKLLVDSAPERRDLHAGERIVAAGVTEATSRLGPEVSAKFCDGPVCIQEEPHQRGASNGCVPHPKDKMLKFWGQWIFKNTQRHSSGVKLSMPPEKQDYGQWDVPEALKDDVRSANSYIFGSKGKDFPMDQFRMCWEALTPSEDFIISPHSACKNLYIATCGSFHGWKFFPIIGKYVVQMLDRTLDASLQAKWAWDREIPAPDNNSVWPRRELKDLATI